MTDTLKIPRLINWAGYLAITLLLLLPLSILTVRAGVWQQGLLLYALSCLGAALVLALFAVLMLLPRFAPWRKTIAGRALLVLPGSILLLMLMANQGDYPPIHDISTDTVDPPVFAMAQQKRGEGTNSLAVDPETIKAQLAGYPDLHPLRTSMPLEKAFEQALRTAEKLGWEVYRQDLNSGYIEAVETTAVMQFKDDIVLRLRSNADGTVIDMRSVSRVGVSDLGANAQRIRKFQETFNELSE